MGTINRVVVVGNLTRDPELRSTPGGASVCRMRIACNTNWRNRDSGELEERPNFFDVSVFGPSGEACARFLAKGRPVAVDGRLEWHEWTTIEGAQRQAVGIIADSVQFLSSRPRVEEDSDEEEETVEEPRAIAF